MNRLVMLAIPLLIIIGSLIVYNTDECTTYCNDVFGNTGSFSEEKSDVEIKYYADSTTISNNGVNFRPASVNSFLIITDCFALYVSDRGGTISHGAYCSIECPEVRVFDNNVSLITISISGFDATITYYNGDTEINSIQLREQKWILFADCYGDYALTYEGIGHNAIYMNNVSQLKGVYSDKDVGYMCFDGSKCYSNNADYDAVVHYTKCNNVDAIQLSGSGYYFADPSKITTQYGLPIVAYYVIYPKEITTMYTDKISITECVNNIYFLTCVEIAVIICGLIVVRVL